MTVDIEAIPLDAPILPVVEERRRRSVQLRRQLAIADILAGAAGGIAGALLAELEPAQLLGMVAVLTIAWPVVAFLCGLYARDDLRTWASGVSEAPKLVLSCLVLSWPLLGLLVAVGAPHAATGALGATIAIAATAGFSRAAARMALHRAPELRQRTLIVGSGVVARRLVDRVEHHPELGLTPVGYIDEEADGTGVLALPRLGDLSALPHLVGQRRIDRVMVAFSRASHTQLLEVLRLCRDSGIPVDVVPRLFEFLDGARTVDQIGGMPLLTIDAPRLSRLSRAAKRALDIVGSVVALVALAPLLAVIAVAIKLDSRGPVLFVQQRAGYGGRFFRLYKFRSMHSGSDVLVRDDGAIVKSADDGRVTRVGRIIRRFSLDEAPQLWNVLRGDMSLVGPRPLVLAEAQALTEEWQARRANLRPGLTGPWQISGRSHIPFHEMIRFDYQYVAGWSLARDVEILLATVPVVLSGRGAY